MSPPFQKEQVESISVCHEQFEEKKKNVPREGPDKALKLGKSG